MSRRSPEPAPAQRPLRARSDRDLAAAFESALAAGDGVAGAHCIHECWMRGHFAAHIEIALDLLWKREPVLARGPLRSAQGRHPRRGQRAEAWHREAARVVRHGFSRFVCGHKLTVRLTAVIADLVAP
jgi:hypothetical protein